MKTLNLLMLGAVFALSACGRSAEQQPGADAGNRAEPVMTAASEPLMGTARDLFKPIPLNPPALAGNEASEAKVSLGRTLYFDPRLSASHAISCASCHNIGLGGADAEPNSIGHRWQRGGRNAPTVFNSAFNFVQFWDGRAKDLTEQAGGPIVNPVEMATPPAHLVEQLKGIPAYAEPFAKAFPGTGDPITADHVHQAIAVFEATLITPNAPFDRYLRGEATALNADQKAGLKLFIDKGCASCHTGVNLGGTMYAKFGVVEAPGADVLPPKDPGRYKITGNEADKNTFKVPTLRNIALTAPYFHSGAVWDLRQAVEIMGKAQLGEALSPEEAGKIEAFLLTLTGDQPQVVVPILPPMVGTTPRPE